MRLKFLPKAAEARAAGKPLVCAHYNRFGASLVLNGAEIPHRVFNSVVGSYRRAGFSLAYAAERAARFVAEGMGAVFGGIAEVNDGPFQY